MELSHKVTFSSHLARITHSLFTLNGGSLLLWPLLLWVVVKVLLLICTYSLSIHQNSRTRYSVMYKKKMGKNDLLQSETFQGSLPVLCGPLCVVFTHCPCVWVSSRCFGFLHEPKTGTTEVSSPADDSDLYSSVIGCITAVSRCSLFTPYMLPQKHQTMGQMQKPCPGELHCLISKLYLHLIAFLNSFSTLNSVY